VDDPEANFRIPWLSRRRLLGSLAGLGAAQTLGWTKKGAAQSSTPDPDHSNIGDGSASSPYQLVLRCNLNQIDSGTLDALAGVLNTQIAHDFAPIWNIHAVVAALPKGSGAVTGTWPIEIVTENSDPVCSHTDSGHYDRYPCSCNYGNPQAYVIYDENHPRLLAHAVSHECLEMLANPHVNLFRSLISPDPTLGTVCYLVEVCDPCWQIDYNYEIDQGGRPYLVTDFVTPRYFDNGLSPIPGVSYSCKGSVIAPRGIALGCNQQGTDSSGKVWWQAVQTLCGPVVSALNFSDPNCD
jgi:hypothetical protein